MREAINELVWEEYLIRERAKGTFVLDYKKKEQDDDYYTYVKSFTYEMNELGATATTTRAEVRKIKADQFLAKQMHVQINEELIELKRLRGVKDEVFVFF